MRPYKCSLSFLSPPTKWVLGWVIPETLPESYLLIRYLILRGPHRHPHFLPNTDFPLELLAVISAVSSAPDPGDHSFSL